MCESKKKRLPKDSMGRYFEFEEADFDWREKEKIRSEINTNYSRYKDIKMGVHISHGIDDKTYKYYFENHGFDDINIYARLEYGDN